MNRNLGYYLRQVLGIESYMIPKNLHEFRSFHGEFPCKTLVVVKQLHPNTHELLKKIMKSIKITEFSILEFKASDKQAHLQNFLKEQRIPQVFIFCSEFQGIDSSTCLFKGEDLTKFIGTGSDVLKKKQELWKQLQGLKLCYH